MSRWSTLLIFFSVCMGTGLTGCNDGSKVPRVESGGIDLTGWDFKKHGSVPLIGQWQFHWQELIPLKDAGNAPGARLVDVPGFWDRLPDLNKPDEQLGPYGYATYTVKLKGLTPGTMLGLRTLLAITAYELYWVESEGIISTAPLMKAGRVDADKIIPQFFAKTSILKVKSPEATIVMYVGNEHLPFAGLPIPLSIDSAQSIVEWENNWFALGSATIAIMLVMSFSHLVLFWLYREEHASLYFGLLCFVLVTYTSVGFMQLQHLFLQEASVRDFIVMMQIFFVGSYLALALLVAFFCAMYPNEFPAKFAHIVWVLMSVLSGACFIIGFPLAGYLNIPFFGITFVVCGIIAVYLFRALLSRRTGSLTILTAFAIAGLAMLHDTLGVSGLLKEFGMPLVPLGTLLIIVAQSIILSKRMVLALHDVKQLSAGLQIEVEERKLVQSDLEIALVAAQEADKLKSAFLANVSHELRTPLNSIINIPAALREQFERCLMWCCADCGAVFGDDKFTDENIPDVEPEPCPDCQVPMEIKSMLIFGGDPAEHYRYLEMLTGSGKQFYGVVTDLMDISRLDAGNLELSSKVVDIGTVLIEVEETVTSLVAEKSLHIEFPELNEPIAIRADSVRLSQILVNLIINAVEFTDSGGEITIAACHSEEPVDKVPCILFSVADTGAGIPLDWQSKIFESFRQVDGSHTRTHQGTGLGLAITRQLVTLHGGRIWVKSELGEGTTFFFTIPED